MGFLGRLLKSISGGDEVVTSDQLLYNKVIGFRGIVEGVGCSTVLQNTAVAMMDSSNMKIVILDMNMLYPCQFDLFECDLDEKGKGDIFDYARGTKLADTLYSSKYQQIKVAGFKRRTVIDMVSISEDSDVIVKYIDELKNYFDVILVDLSQETTNMAIFASIKCNKIFTVADTSRKCLGNVLNSINYTTTLGTSYAKCRRLIVNKDIPEVNSGVKVLNDEFKFNTVATIPFTKSIVQMGIAGKPFWGMPTKEQAITDAHIAIQAVVDDILEKNDDTGAVAIKSRGKKAKKEDFDDIPVVQVQRKAGVTNEDISFEDEPISSVDVVNPIFEDDKRR